MSEKICLCLGVLEDDAAWSRPILESIRLQNPNCIIRTAIDGKSFCRLLSQLPVPRLIILDLNVFGLNGYEVLCIIRARRDLDSIPVVILTTDKSIETKTKCLAARANGVYYKVADDIPGVIKTIIKNHLYEGPLPEKIDPPLLNETVPLGMSDVSNVDDLLDKL